MALEYKESPLGAIPKEWEVVRLGNITEINKNSRDPAKEIPNDIFLYIDIDSIDGGTGIIREAKKIVGKDAPSRARRVIHKNDVIMSTVRPYLKAFAIVPEEYDNHICSTGFAVLSCKDSVVPRYLLYSLFSNIVINQCSRMMIGGQYPALNNSQVSKIKIPLPPFEEQQKISEILSTVDDAIQQVNEVIAKTERLKWGLMQELLTRGIGHKEFKDSDIGRIPRKWKVVKVGDILSLEYGSGLPERERIPGAYPVVGSNGIVGYHNQAIVKGPGIVVGRKGTIGAVSWIDQDFWPIDTTYYVKIRTTRVSLRWLFYELIYLNPARFDLADVVPGLKRELVHSLKMGYPLLHEQQKIASILSTVDKKLELERKRKEKLERMKKGLMNDLLTGKVRVKV